MRTDSDFFVVRSHEDGILLVWKGREEIFWVEYLDIRLYDQLMKIESNTLTTANMTEVNEIDKIITKGMLLAEKSIYFYRSNHPWSPILAKAFLDVQLWKITLSIILNKSQDKKQLTTSLLEWHIIIILQTISIAQTLNNF